MGQNSEDKRRGGTMCASEHVLYAACSLYTDEVCSDANGLFFHCLLLLLLLLFFFNVAQRGSADLEHADRFVVDVNQRGG